MQDTCCHGGDKMTSLEPINILLIEDNLGDIRLTEEALKEHEIKIKLNVVMDGEEAMKYLRKTDAFANAQTPDIILLDLNLPKKDGREILKEIKEDQILKSIPVIVLTISSAERDIMTSYQLHANCYITKPLDFNQFIEVIKKTGEYWFSIVKLPIKNHDKTN